MAYLPDERFKHTLHDLEDCLDAITDDEVEKPSEKQKAIKLFQLFLDFCLAEALIDRYDLTNLYYKMGLSPPVQPPALHAGQQ